jgi:hypothetical protein
MTRPGAIVTDRDRAILRSVADYRLLTPEQLQRLHFPSAQTTLRRLRRLEDAGLLLRQRSDAIPTHLVSLTSLGTATLRGGDAPCSGSAVERRLPVRLPGAYFLKHLLEVNDFRIGLELNARQRLDLEVLGVLADMDRSATGPAAQPRAVLSETVTFEGERGERMAHTPDLAFGLRRNERQALFLIEIDRGTEVVGDPRRGVGLFVRFYLRALVTGAFEGLGAKLGGREGFRGFRVLVVTTSSARVEAIRERWGTMPMEQDVAKRFIWLSVRDATHSRSLLEREWVSLDPRDESRYVIAAQREERLA